jgi:hypothetical protein
VPIERENIGNLLQERNLILPQDKNIQKMLILVSLKLPYYMLEYYLKVVLFLMTLILSRVVLARYFGTGELSNTDRIG